jgi:fluoride exporter
LIRYLIIMFGAALGGGARALVATAIAERVLGKFPWGTFIVNLSGCFAIGVAMTLLTERYHPNPYWRLFLVVGFLGGYTTFSSFEYENVAAVRTGDMLIALINMAGSLLLGYVAVWLGYWAALKR